MDNKTFKTCEKCKYFKQYFYDAVDACYKIPVERDEWGYCYRFPKVRYKNEDEFCGEYKDKYMENV